MASAPISPPRLPMWRLLVTKTRQGAPVPQAGGGGGGVVGGRHCPPWHVPPGHVVPSGFARLHLPCLRCLQGGHDFLCFAAARAVSFAWSRRLGLARLSPPRASPVPSAAAPARSRTQLRRVETIPSACAIPSNAPACMVVSVLWVNASPQVLPDRLRPS